MREGRRIYGLLGNKVEDRKGERWAGTRKVRRGQKEGCRRGGGEDARAETARQVDCDKDVGFPNPFSFNVCHSCET